MPVQLLSFEAVVTQSFFFYISMNLFSDFGYAKLKCTFAIIWLTRKTWKLKFGAYLVLSEWISEVMSLMFETGFRYIGFVFWDFMG